MGERLQGSQTCGAGQKAASFVAVVKRKGTFEFAAANSCVFL
jgi:hypothetical protein